MNNNSELCIFHIDTEKNWRGGQQQSFYLHKSLVKQGFKSYMLCKKNSVMSDKCKSENLAFINFPLKSELDFYSAFKIANYTKKLNVKILHLHTAHALSLGILIKLFNPKLKLIAVRRVDFSLKKNALSFLKYNNRFLDKLVCISKNIVNVVENDGVPKSKIKMIYSGIDIDRYSPENNVNLYLRNKYKLSDDCVIIGTVAALVGHKDYPSLLRAARIVLESKSNVVFISAGDGHSYDELMHLHSNLKLAEKFIFSGFESNIKDFLHSIDIFVLSSKKEGLGTSVLDAMSAGKPIVACDSGGIPEMIVHQKNGLLAKKENPQDLAEKIIYMIDNYELRQKYSKQALEDVKSFSIDNTINENIKLYKELLK